MFKLAYLVRNTITNLSTQDDLVADGPAETPGAELRVKISTWVRICRGRRSRPCTAGKRSIESPDDRT
jgi:hypothetical protein